MKKRRPKAVGQTVLVRWLNKQHTHGEFAIVTIRELPRPRKKRSRR